jgi:Holliday junction resolvase
MRAKRVDDNQARIVKQLRQLGLSVRHLHMVGNGLPDIIVGYRKQNFLIEIKDYKKKKSQKKLTADEQEFFDTWRGQVSKCETLEEILKVVGL